MLNVWTCLIVSLSQFSSKISRKSLKLERPWQGLSQLFTLKFWFLNLKKYYLKQNIKGLEYNRYNIDDHNWRRSHGVEVSWALGVTSVLSRRPNSNERPGPEQVRLAGPRCGGHWGGDTGSPNIGHRLRLDLRWAGKYTPRNTPEDGMMNPPVSSRKPSAHCGVASI